MRTILFIALMFFCRLSMAQKQTVEIIRNIRYASAQPELYKDTSSDRTLDLYVPKEKDKKYPVLIFVHGGGFSGGDKEGTKELCSNISKQGFIVASINYRLYLKGKNITEARADVNMGKGLPENGKFYPELQKAVEIASEDIVLALGWLKKNTSKYNFDLKSIALGGGSAGSMAVLYTAYLSGQRKLPVKAVINLWGGLENAFLIKIHKKLPPLLSYHGDEDKIINVAYAHALQKKMQELGSIQSVTNIIEGKGHALYALIARYKMEEVNHFLQQNLKK